jgi:anti-anti-sigma factor
MTQDPSCNVFVRDGCIRLSGELVSDGALSMSEQLRPLIASGAPTIDLDLTGVTFIDSVGLRELLRLKHSVPTLRVVAVSPPLQRRFALTGTTELLMSAAPGGA